MPPGFEFPLFEDLWLPLRIAKGTLPRDTGPKVWAIGRLRDGVGRDEAQAEMTTLATRLAAAYPETNAGRGVRVRDYRQSLNSKANTAILGAMFGAVCLVLVIACANVASLLLARASVRSRELAIRSALGGSRWRVAGLIVFESLVLSVLGSAGGLALAHLGTTALDNAFSWQALPYWITFKIQPPAVVFAVVAGTATGLLSGLLPALRASGAVCFDLLKDEARGSSGMRIGRLSRLLVVTELALAFALLVATGLMVRTVINYNEIDPGFATESIFTADVTLPQSAYPNPGDAVAFYERLADDLRGLAEVEAAAVSSSPPGAFMGLSSYGIEGVALRHE